MKTKSSLSFIPRGNNEVNTLSIILESYMSLFLFLKTLILESLRNNVIILYFLLPSQMWPLFWILCTAFQIHFYTSIYKCATVLFYEFLNVYEYLHAIHNIYKFILENTSYLSQWKNNSLEPSIHFCVMLTFYHICLGYIETIQCRYHPLLCVSFYSSLFLNLLKCLSFNYAFN